MCPARCERGRECPSPAWLRSACPGSRRYRSGCSTRMNQLPEDDPHFSQSRLAGRPMSAATRRLGRWACRTGNCPRCRVRSIRRPGTAHLASARHDRSLGHAVDRLVARERYTLRCRTIDANDIAQPMPRPFPKSGANQIQAKKITVQELIAPISQFWASPALNQARNRSR